MLRRCNTTRTENVGADSARRWGRHTLLAWLAALASSALADSASLRVVTERSFPDGWTEPEVTSSAAGSSYAPSIPSGSTPRDTGTVLDVGSSTVHTSGGNSNPEMASARIDYRYRLLLPNRTAVTLTLGSWKSIGTDAVRLTRLASGDFALQYRNAGRTLRLRAPAGAAPPASGGRTPQP
jgi:hypothetical protein